MRRNESPRARWSALLALVPALALGCAELQGLGLERLLTLGAPLDENTVAQGLKQALDVGTQRTTSMLSATGGFSDSPVFRLGLPGQMGQLAEVMRKVGFGAQVDELELAMNRAAEQAAGKAVPVFASAITSMSISDAFEILRGEPDAATRYFERRTSDELKAEFKPVAGLAMREVGLYGIYEELVRRYDAIPFTKPPAVDLESFVADQTLAAIFTELAKEEERIREDPAARTTQLLRRVFSESASTPSTSASAASP